MKQALYIQFSVENAIRGPMADVASACTNVCVRVCVCVLRLVLSSGPSSCSSLPWPALLPPLLHLFLCFCSFYFWLCFSVTFLIESLWKNSILVSVGPSKKGIVHSSARIAKGYWPPPESRWTSGQARTDGKEVEEDAQLRLGRSKREHQGLGELAGQAVHPTPPSTPLCLLFWLEGRTEKPFHVGVLWSWVSKLFPHLGGCEELRPQSQK